MKNEKYKYRKFCLAKVCFVIFDIFYRIGKHVIYLFGTFFPDFSTKRDFFKFIVFEIARQLNFSQSASSKRLKKFLFFE